MSADASDVTQLPLSLVDKLECLCLVEKMIIINRIFVIVSTL